MYSGADFQIQNRYKQLWSFLCSKQDFNRHKCKQEFTFSQLVSVLLILQNLPQIVVIRHKLLKLEVKGGQVKQGGHLEK